MKYLKLILIMMISLSAWPALTLPPLEQMLVQRFTDLGELRLEVGTLFFPEGFIPTNSSEVPAEVKFALFTPEVLAAISGKFVTPLSEYTLLSHVENLEHFTRSVETYSINDIPYVIVSVNITAATVKKPKVTIFAVDPLASETASDSGQFMVTLNAPTTKNIRVKFSIRGKATKGRDYQRFAPSLLIPAGNVSGIIEVFPVDDVKHEGTETVILKLVREGVTGYTVGRRAAATVRILDND